MPTTCAASGVRGQAAEGGEEAAAQLLLAALQVGRRLDGGDGGAAGVELLAGLGQQVGAEPAARRVGGVGGQHVEVAGRRGGGEDERQAQAESQVHRQALGAGWEWRAW